MSTQIDLKQTQVFIRDGFNAAAQVNLLAGYAIGLATMAIDNHVGVIPTGSTFKVGTDETIYEVISHTETSGSTTSITFAPGLVVAAVDGGPVVFQPNQIEVRIGEGNLTFEEKHPRKYVLNRGLLDSVKDDDQAPLDVTMDFVWDHIIGDPCQPYCIDLVVLYTPLCANVDPEQIVLPKFRYDSLSHDVKNGAVAMKGSCNVTKPIVTRIAS